MKKCIAVLTRGYEHFHNYSLLIQRNKHIENNLLDKTIDILIFHEGNITEQHQIEIAQQTPLLKIIFLNIKSSKAFRNEKENTQFYQPTLEWGIGYRHMCSFWFADFLHFVSEYDYLVRIDEDCNIYSNVDYIFTKLNEYCFISGTCEKDQPHVTLGLNQFTIDFVNKNSDSYVFKQNEVKDPPSGPYTNLFGISLNFVRTHDILLKYIQEIDFSNKIYENRWGDLPLWGEVIDYITGKESIFIDNTIKYYHASHCMQVN